MKKIFASIKGSRSFYSLVGLLGLVVLSSILSSDFRSFDNMITILRQASTLLILSSGLTAVLLTGGMDLSVGATAGFVGCVCAQVLKMGVPIIGVFAVGIVLGAIIGCFNGFLVGIVKLPSFIATYATNWVVGGLSIIVMNGAVIYGLPEGFTWFGTGYIGPIPVIVIIAAILVTIVYILLQKTTYGRDVYAYGANHEAALYSAVPVNRILISTFVMCSICAGIAGLMMTARLNAAEAAMGDAYGLQTVAAVVIGGTSMLGGEGGIIGTAIGAMILTVIVNIMNLLGISSYAQPMVVGLVIILMVLMDTRTRYKRKRHPGKVAVSAA